MSLTDESLPPHVIELIRHQLKDKKTMQEYFSKARKITKNRMIESESILKKSNPDQDEIAYATANVMVCIEKLQRIDDFEMIHLNLIDLQEQIKNNK